MKVLTCTTPEILNTVRKKPELTEGHNNKVNVSICEQTCMFRHAFYSLTHEYLVMNSGELIEFDGVDGFRKERLLSFPSLVESVCRRSVSQTAALN
jgi:hypothetical protein